MAKATFACAGCGTPVTVGGSSYNRRRADSYAAYCAKRGDLCETCRRAAFEAENAQASAVTAEVGLAPLSGSEKQVAWGNKIRLEMLPRIDAGAATAIDWISRSNHHRFTAAAMEEIRDAVALIASELRGTTEARWWIDYRTAQVADLVLKEFVRRASTLAPTAYSESRAGEA